MPTARSRKARSRVPTREDVLEFVRENPGLVGKRELAKAFGVKGSDRVALKQLLRDMSAEGLLEKSRKRLTRPQDLPSVSVLRIYGRDEDGDLLAVPRRWPEDEKGPPPVVVIAGRGGRGRQTADAGVSDHVLARLERTGDHPLASYSGRILKILDKAPGLTLGVVERTDRGYRVLPVDRKQPEMILDRADEDRVAPGDLVSVDAQERRVHGLPRASLIERIGSMSDEKAISRIAIHKHQIPLKFSRATEQATARLEPIDLSGRTDWREIPLITIDPVDAKDHDDAVQAEPDPDPANPGGWIIRVAIADVAAYVRPGSPFDKDARERGNSVYFPDQVVPMLPERISNDLCSLRPHQDRPALAVEMVVAASGIKRRHRFRRVAMRSHARLSYQAAQKAIDGEPDATAGPLLEPALRPLWQAYATLVKARTDRSPLDLDLPERKIVLTAEGKVDHIAVPERLDAHRLIEEFMILANVAAAETLEERRSPLIYRIHDVPGPEKLDGFRAFVASLDMNFPKQGNVRPDQFNQILRKVRGSDHEEAVNQVVLRSQSQAEYNPDNIGHFGLNLHRYAHFTSPIRRYADLIVHRALISALDLGSDGLPADAAQHLPTIASEISATERRAMAAERETADRLIAGWLAERIGATFSGRISGVTKSGLFVRLSETGADGFIPISTLGNEYFVFEEQQHRLTGDKTGTTFRIGQPVEVKLIDALPFAGALRFELLEGGTPGTGPARKTPADRPARRSPGRRR